LHQDVSDDKSVTSEQEEKIDVLVNSTWYAIVGTFEGLAIDEYYSVYIPELIILYR
jgi:hypothetical protein